MILWIVNNAATIIISLLLAAAVFFIILKAVKNRKEGKAGCSCGCKNCSMNCKGFK